MDQGDLSKAFQHLQSLGSLTALRDVLRAMNALPDTPPVDAEDQALRDAMCRFGVNRHEGAPRFRAARYPYLSEELQIEIAQNGSDETRSWLAGNKNLCRNARDILEIASQPKLRLLTDKLDRNDTGPRPDS